MAKKINNADLILSYIITTAKYDFSVYEKRILYRIIEMNQHLLEGKKLNIRHSIDKTLFGDRVYTLPIASLLKNEEDKNHHQIKMALTSLRNKTLEYEDEKVWRLIGIIEKPIVDKYQTTISFELDKLVYNALMDFSKGYRIIELKTAMEFESVYAMRFYELLSNKKEPVKYTVEALKEMFCIKDKYKLTADFMRYVILPAQKELDKKSPYTFTYEPYKHGRKIVGFTFYPVDQPQFRDEELEARDLAKKVPVGWVIPKELRTYLEDNFGFTKEEIKRNADLLKRASHSFDDLILWLSKKRRTANEKDKPKAYIIGAIKSELKTTKNTTS